MLNEDVLAQVSGRELEKRRKAVTAALAHLVHEEKGRALLDSRIQVQNTCRLFFPCLTGRFGKKKIMGGLDRLPSFNLNPQSPIRCPVNRVRIRQ